MSQHAIEDLIERHIHLVDRSGWDGPRKTALIRGLLQLQARYDTGLTWFRMHAVLLRHGVLVRTAIEDIEDGALRAQAQAADAPGWLEQTDGPVYLAWEDQSRALYWQPDTGHTLPLASVFGDALQLADQADDAELFADTYALLVNGWLDDTFDTDDGIAPTLDGLLASETLLAIRALAAGRGLTRRHGAPEDLALPRLDDNDTRGEIERESGLRFFLQPKLTPAALRSARDKAQRQQRRVRELLPQLIEHHLGTPLQAAGWLPVPVEADQSWQWMRDRHGSRQCLWASYDASLGELMLQAGLQHARLLAWQQRAASTQLHDLHFVDAATAFLGDDILHSKDVGAYAGWALDPASSDTALSASLDRLATALPVLDARYFGFITDQLAGPWFERSSDAWLQLLEEGDDTGVIPPTVLFANPDSLLLAFVFFHLEQGDQPRAHTLVEQLRARLAARSRPSAWHRESLAPFLQQWGQGLRNLPMPPVLHPLQLSHLQAQHSV
ncbi:hypothetical protein HG421_01170 [Xanthomonas campestris pv. badrii]|uniref:Uncharacterized protein n=1 Tax=Xanthomonas campestris pv. badrii TaxID=149696 RepID=A0A7Z2V7D9_XANCA|nr:hypothetical protein [Xanthomonas campestris]QJD66471.1 hypothetical protein HG421_01170 [Xanthomonas campestris pv. badrii]